jgi:hypothetical protein
MLILLQELTASVSYVSVFYVSIACCVQGFCAYHWEESKVPIFSLLKDIIT